MLLVTGNMVSFAYARRDQRVTEEFNPKKRIPTPANGTPSLKDRASNIYFSFALPGALTIGMEHLKYAVGLENHSMNPGYPTGVMLAHGYTQNGIDEQLIDESWAIFKGQLAALSHTLDELNIPLTVVYSPPRFMLSKSRVENLKWVDTDRFSIDPIDVTSKICQDLHITFIDPRDPLSQATKPVYILSDYTHFDASGNKAIAQVIAKTITNPN